MIRKRAFHKFKVTPVAHLFNPSPYNGSPKVNTAENAPPERNSPSLNYFFIILQIVRLLVFGIILFRNKCTTTYLKIIIFYRIGFLQLVAKVIFRKNILGYFFK